MIHSSLLCCFNIASCQDGQFFFPLQLLKCLKGSWKSLKVSRKVSNPASPQSIITLPNCKFDLMRCHVGMLSAVRFRVHSHFKIPCSACFAAKTIMVNEIQR